MPIVSADLPEELIKKIDALGEKEDRNKSNTILVLLKMAFRELERMEEKQNQ